MTGGRSWSKVAGGKFVKHLPNHFALELEKALKMAEVSRNSNFLFPDLLDYDQKAKTMSFRYIPEMRSIRIWYLNFLKMQSVDGQVRDLFFEVGKALGSIHKALSMSSRSSLTVGTVFAKAMTEVWGANYEAALVETPFAYLHGDFGFANVNVLNEGNGNSIVVFDPSPNEFMTTRPDHFASIYIDLANFVSCLEGLVPVSNYPFMRWRLSALLKEEFIEGYEEMSEIAIDQDLLDCVSFATARSYFASKFRMRVLQSLAMRALYNSAKGNLPRVGGKRGTK